MSGVNVSLLLPLFLKENVKREAIHMQILKECKSNKVREEQNLKGPDEPLHLLQPSQP